jgi:hypothetical protein
MRQYDVDAKNVYNMDEKGFLIGKTSRSKRVFSKQQQERDAANAQKSLQLSQRGKRAASQKDVQKAKRARRAVVVQDGVEAAEAAPPAPPNQLRTRLTKAPHRYSE